jgi:hypothetical protein
MAAQMNINDDDATQKFDDAQDAADASAAALRVFLGAFDVVLLGGLAAALGGSLAVRVRLLVTHRTFNDGHAQMTPAA